MQKELYEKLQSTLQAEEKLILQDNNSFVTIEHEKLVNLPEGQIRISFLKKDDPNFYDSLVFIKKVDQYHSYRLNADHSDEDEVSDKDLSGLAAKINNALSLAAK
jgi:hypothetical protein